MPVAKKAYVSDGTNWLPLVSGLPDLTGYATTEYVDNYTPSISVSASPPASPEQGEFWFDTDTNELFMYDSVYWVEISGTAIDLAEYLTISSASATYATQTDLDNIDLSLYLTQSSASTTYLTQASASTTYESKVLDIVAAKTSAYTFASGDENKIIELNGTFTVTIPPDSTFNFPIGTYINILQITSGTITIAGGAGVTVNGAPGLKLNSQWSGASIVKRSSNTWVAVGDLAA